MDQLLLRYLQFPMDGLTSINATSKATILTSENMEEINALKDLMKVVPVAHVLSYLNIPFTYSFTPNSVIVLQLTIH